MYSRGQWVCALLLASVAHAGLISQLAPTPPSGHDRAGEQGVELSIQLAAPQSSAPEPRSQAPAAPAAVASLPQVPRTKPLTERQIATVAKQPKPAPAQRAGGPQGTTDYYAKLQAWLNAHKNYPTEARHQGWEGVTELEFVVQADGTVAWSRLARSSGYLMLDGAAERLLAEAQPLPPPPADLDAAARHVRVPISYRLY